MATPATVIRPQPGPQEAFLASPADIVIYGGAAFGVPAQLFFGICSTYTLVEGKANAQPSRAIMSITA